MRKIYILILIILPIALYAEKPSREQLLAEAYVDYGNVAGGWYLNERCSFITNDELNNYEKNVALITTTLGKDSGNPKMLLMIQKSAKGVAYNEKYSDCGSEPEDIVKKTSSHAKAWANQIRKITGGN